MISYSAKSSLEAVKKTFIHMYEQTPVAEDPELWKEESGFTAITGLENEPSYITQVGDKFEYSFDYKPFFPFVSYDVIQSELDYWPKELIHPARLKELISYLKENELSKRAIISLWEDKHRDLSMKCPCTTTIFFRKKGEYLEMHTHMRANNASFLLFMDSSFLTGIQSIVAEELGLKRGTYIHFFDSLHFYRTEMEMITEQYNFMKESDLWNKI